MYIRRKLAERWGIPPWQVDTVPWYEIELELKLARIEDGAARFRKANGY